ncbi:MAG: hypothetical protein JO270_24030, partial [Acidobacteriaceae bacterium]|nr:hypothetical protein [Acidobacteriaceae bacterium]
DTRGNLWVASVGSGIARIDLKGSVTRYTEQSGLPSSNAFCLDSDSRGAVWICTDRGLARLANGYIRIFNQAEGLPGNQVRASCEAADGTRWVAGIDFGLSRWSGTHFQAYSDNVVRPGEKFSALLCAHDGSIWAGGSGLVHISGSGSRRITTRDGLPDNQISSLAESSDGALWAGSDDGISRIRNEEISVYRTRDGLSHSVVLSLYFDREGSLWAGTKDGLDQFTDANVTPYTTNDGLLSNDSGPVIEDAAARLWIGTMGAGLNWFDGHRFHALTSAQGLIGNTILSLARDGANDLWVGTSQGISRLRNGVPVASYTRADGLSGDKIQALFIDKDATLWAGTANGLDRFNGRRFVRADFVPRNQSGGIVALDGGRTVQLFASVASPRLYVLKDDRSSAYNFDVSRAVDCYYIDHARRIVWMGTLGSGLLRWKDGVITHVRVKDGLYDNRIYSILSDGKSNLWLASSKGIFRVSDEELEQFAHGQARFVTSIPFSTGQLRFECRAGVQPAACRTRDGRLWFSTTSGLVVVDPAHLRANRIAPPVTISAVIVNGKRSEPQSHLSLKPGEQNNLEIRYAGLSFISPEKVTFRYRLEGFDKNWTDAGTRREAFFTNLPPGHYRFLVTARNADGISSAGTAALAFTVEPRMYQRWWFFPVLAAFLGLAAMTWYRLRIRRLKHSFDLVLAERSRIARELHDTLLQGLTGITLHLQALWARLPASREKTFLADIIRDAGNCATAARQSLWGLRTERPDSLEFSDKLAHLAHRSVHGTPLSLQLEIESVSLRATPAAEFELIRIAQEAMSNAVQHARASVLRVSLQLRHGTLRLTVEDDGIGFDYDAFDRPGHFGLVGMRERARDMGADLAVLSQPNRGTKIVIALTLQPADVRESNAEMPVGHPTR